MRGKLIVIDGTDGSGKATQVALLAERLKQAGHDIWVADFPRYGQTSAYMVENYLNGRYGTLPEIGPHRGSVFYAIDRHDASFDLREHLESGKIILSNRYTTASMAHQGGKISDRAERQKFFEWLDHLEHDVLSIPRPDLNIILHVDPEIGQRLVDEKAAREYTQGKKRDIHEADIEHLRAAERVYLEMASQFPNFKLIECTEDGSIMSREAINELIWQHIQELIHDNS